VRTGHRTREDKNSLKVKSIVKIKSFVSKFGIASVAVIVVLVSSVPFAGQRQRTDPAPPPNIASYLPASDAIAVVDVKRMLNETMPGILGGDAAKLAEANAEVDKFKTKTGRRLALNGARSDRHSLHVSDSNFNQIGNGRDRSRTAHLTHGRWRLLFGQLLMESRVKKKYRGATITIINVNDDLKLLGLWSMRVNELAICMLESKLGRARHAGERARGD